MDKQAVAAAVSELVSQMELIRAVADPEDGSVTLTKAELDELAQAVDAVEQSLEEHFDPEVADVLLNEAPGTNAKREAERQGELLDADPLGGPRPEQNQG